MRAWLEDIIDDLRLAISGPVGRWRAVRLARGPLAGVALALLCAAVYLPGQFRIPPVDRDEARFAQASRQMFESVALPPESRETTDHLGGLHDGGLVVPMLAREPRLNKPPLVYWLQAATAAVLTGGDPHRDAIWMYRLPSAACAVLTVLITWRLGAGMFDSRVGFVGAALLAVCPMVVWDAHQARADQLLLACTTLAMAALWCVHRGATRRVRTRATVADRAAPFVFWVSLSLGVLAKGPITPMIASLAALALCLATRRWVWLRATRPVVGAVVVGVLALPWLVAVAALVGPGEYWSIVTGETIGRSAGAMEGHWGPPGYHLVLLVVLFWPGVLLTGAAIGRAARRAHGWTRPTASVEPAAEDTPESVNEAHSGAPPAAAPDEPTADEPGTPPTSASRDDARPGLMRRAWGVVAGPHRGRRAELFCLCWIAPAWLVFELVATKLPHYTLPLYPPIALLTARGLLAAAAGALPSADSPSAALGYRLWFGVGAAVLAGPVLAAAVPGGLPLILAGALVAAGALLLLRAAWRRLTTAHYAVAQGWSVLAVVLALAGLLGVVLPNARGLWITPQLGDLIARSRAADGAVPVASVGYHEDSLVFETRGRIERIDDAAAWLRANPRGVLIARPEDLPTPDLGLPDLREVGRVRGFNYSRGRVTDLVVVESER